MTQHIGETVKKCKSAINHRKIVFEGFNLNNPSDFFPIAI